MSVRADYAVRACAVLAAHGGLLKAEAVAAEQDLPAHFLRSILGALRQAGIVTSRRGPDGGYGLARPASSVSLAEVVRAVDLPATARPTAALPQAVLAVPADDGQPAAAPRELDLVWTAVQACVMDLLEHVTIADVATASLPDAVQQLATGRDHQVPATRAAGLGLPLGHLRGPVTSSSTRSGVNSAFC